MFFLLEFFHLFSRAPITITYLPSIITSGGEKITAATSGTITINVNNINIPPTAISITTPTLATYNGSYSILILTGNDYEDGTNLKNLSISTLPIYGDLYDIDVNGVVGTSKLNVGSTTSGMRVAYRLKTNFWTFGVRRLNFMFFFLTFIKLPIYLFQILSNYQRMVKLSLVQIQ